MVVENAAAPKDETTKKGIFDRLTTSVADAVELWIALKVYEIFAVVIDNLEYKVGGVENLEAAKEHLRNGGRLIVTFAPHQKTLDPYIITELLRNNLTNGDDWSWGWIASEKFRKNIRVDGISNKLGIASLLLEKLVEENNFEVFYFVQNYIVSLLKSTHADGVYSQANAVNAESREELLKFLAKPGSILVLSPEATRNIVPGLMRADPAAGFVMMPRRNVDNIMILPLSIGGVPSIRTDKLGVVKDLIDLKRKVSSGDVPEVEARFGELVSYDELKVEAREHMWAPGALSRIAQNERSIMPRRETDFRFVDALMLRISATMERMECYRDNPSAAGIYSSENVIQRVGNSLN